MVSSSATTTTTTKATKKKKSSSSSSSSSSSKTTTTTFYKFCAAKLPDKLFHNEIDVKKWIGTYNEDNNDNESENENENENKKYNDDTLPSWMTTTSSKNGFHSAILNTVLPLQDKMVDYERCVGISLYMIGNVAPFLIPLLLLIWCITSHELLKNVVQYLIQFLVLYQGTLYLIERCWFVPYFLKKYQFDHTDHKNNCPKQSQYLFTERNTTKYCSLSYVWPSTIHRPVLESTNVIYCLIPHGLAPYGIVGYPYWSKIWNNKLCSWTCAPILLKLPLIGSYMKSIGYIPAKSKNILDALTKKDVNVGIILDGIDGMFHSTNNDEVGAILKRKGIIKIALKAGVPIIPCYGFGHTQLYDIYVDPFGILQYLSKKLNMSLTPFFGRYGWFMGPPKRNVAVTVCLGEPIYPPSLSSSSSNDNNINNSDIITQDQIDLYHTKLLDGFTTVFETHKSGYYGNTAAENKKLIFVE